MSSEYLSIAEGRERGGLRLVVIRGVPSPWTQAAKGIFYAKGIDFTLVQLAKGEDRQGLMDWTGQDSFPAAMFQDERPRTGWEEILWLAERLAPTPSLVPTDPSARALMFGLAREICGELGLGWCRRLVGMGDMMRQGVNKGMAAMAPKYLSSEEESATSQARVVEVLSLLKSRLERSQADGGRYFMGDQLTAVDIYWATFCNLISPLPDDQLPLPPGIAGLFTAAEPETQATVEGALLAHRDFIYETHLELPVEV